MNHEEFSKVISAVQKLRQALMQADCAKGGFGIRLTPDAISRLRSFKDNSGNHLEKYFVQRGSEYTLAGIPISEF